jgi:chitinase
MGVAGKRGVVSYARNDSLQGSPYTKTGLTPGTTYYFYVVAVDWGNNESAPSNKVTVTVP